MRTPTRTETRRERPRPEPPPSRRDRAEARAARRDDVYADLERLGISREDLADWLLRA